MQNTTSLTNRKGITIETPFTNEEAAAFVKEHRVDNCHNSFAYELWAKSLGSKGISGEQWFWVHKLAVEALAEVTIHTVEPKAKVVYTCYHAGQEIGEVTFPADGSGYICTTPIINPDTNQYHRKIVGSEGSYGILTKVVKPTEGGDLEINTAGVLGIFATAKANGLKYPKLRLQTPSGEPVILSISSDNAKVPGAVNISNGGEFGTPANKWFGRITREGEFQGSKSTTPEIINLVKSLGEDAGKTVTEYGKLTGCCAVCGRGLDNKVSIDRGIGPVCAKKIGLAA
jgi:hypothetical protein